MKSRTSRRKNDFFRVNYDFFRVNYDQFRVNYDLCHYIMSLTNLR